MARLWLATTTGRTPTRWRLAAFAGALVCIVCAGPAASQVPVRVATWNVQSGQADPAVIGGIMAAMDGIDLWGLSEVPAAGSDPLARGAEEGEAADFGRILGTTGRDDRLMILYDAERFEVVAWEELHAVNTTGRVRSPLVAHFREADGSREFLFMVNHLYRSRAEERHRQARLLNAWVAAQALPVIAVGDYNFDWEVEGGEARHDPGYDLFTAGDRFVWVRPDRLVRTQCTPVEGGCRYDSVLDFVFVAGEARSWPATSEIVVRPGDFPDDDATSDHRPVVADIRIPDGP